VHHAFPLGEDHEEVLRRKGYRGPVTHLPLGVDTRHFTPDKTDPHFDAGLPRPIIGFVGDFLPARNLPLLIEALSRCSQKLGLLIVGDGPNRDDLERFVAERGMEKRVIFTGKVTHADMPHYLNAVDMLVLPSTPVTNRCFGVFHIANAEQFDRVLIEAMACGKPVIGSSCGEIPRVVADCGLIFPDGDINALAICLDRLGRDAALREQLGQMGRARARDYYDWEVIARKFLSAVEK
jgi:glycosyltransferase involved in cell wall biosynthesis